MKKSKGKDPLLMPLPDMKRRGEELKLLAMLDDKNSDLYKKLVAEGKYKIISPIDVERKDILFSEPDDRLEDIGEGNFRVMPTSEIGNTSDT